jgi:hypothetical protein
MLSHITHLDRLLRGQTTDPQTLMNRGIDVPVVGLTMLATGLASLYGLCMGLFAVTGGGSGHAIQILASAVKVPLLFLVTLLVTLPSLYVFNAMVGSRLGLTSVVKLLIGAMAVTVAVLSSLGPIVAFFAVSGSSYPFMLLLNVAVFALSGALGMSFLLRTLKRLSALDPCVASPGPDEQAPLVDASTDQNVTLVFRIWLLLFGFVGAQTGWILRPFIGSPGKEFTWLRPRGGSFFDAVWRSLMQLLDIG